MPNYIVDPLNGIDTNSGLTESTAVRTFMRAADLAIAGDFVLGRGGIYLPNDGNAGFRTKRNGLPAAPITFKNYGNEEVIIKHQFVGIMVEHSWITLLGLGIINDTQAAGFPMETGICHWENHGPISHIIVDGCPVRNIKPGDPSHGIRLENTSYGIVRKCIVDHVGTAPQPGPEGGNGLWITGNYNLVEDNLVDFCGHAGMFLMGDKVVARRNNFNGSWGVCAEYLCFGTTAYRSLVEDNILRNASGLQGGLWRDPAWEQMGSGTIFRRNRLYRSVGTGVQIYSRADYQSWHNRYYHNVIYECGGVPPPSYLCAPYEIQEDVAGTQGDNISVNNIHFFNKRNDRATFAGTGNQSVIAFLTNLWNDTDPLFVNAPAGDFRLRPGSPAINAGEFLTRVAAGGSGRALPVLDARYFCDGWGIVEGDYVQLEGTSGAIQIESIDYQTNTIVLKESASWQAGQGVSLPFLGSRPDIGAFEYIGGYMPTASINIILDILGIPGITVTATPTSRSIQKGQSTTYQLAVAAVDGYAGVVTFAVAGLPAGVTAAFSPVSVTPGQSTTLTITTQVNSPVGTVTLTVTATGA